MRGHPAGSTCWTDLFISRGTPATIHSGNGPDFVAAAVKAWITGLGARPAYIEPGSPWENGYVESFNGKFRDELLACEAFNTLAEARVLIEQWRKHYNNGAPAQLVGLPAPGTRGRPAEGARHSCLRQVRPDQLQHLASR